MFQKIRTLLTDKLSKSRSKRFGQSLGAKLFRIVETTFNTVIYNEVARESAILSYYGILTIIPILVFFFRLSEKLFSNEDLINSLIDRFPNYADQIKEIGFAASNVSDAGTGVVLLSSFFVFCWAGLLMLSSIEDSLNKISGYVSLRMSFRRTLSYFVVILISPMLFILTYGSLIYTTKILPIQYPDILSLSFSMHLLKIGSVLFPFVVTTLTLFCCYFFLPKTKVVVSSAWISSLIFGFVYVYFQHWFFILQLKLFNYSFTYGALVALPSFLFLLYICFFIFLTGGALTFSIQNYGFRFFNKRNSLTESYEKIVICLEILSISSQAFDQGLSSPSIRELSEITFVPIGEIAQCIDILINRGLLVELYNKKGEQTYAPSHNISNENLTVVLKKIIGDSLVDSIVKRYPANYSSKKKLENICPSSCLAIEQALKKLLTSLKDSRHNVTLSELYFKDLFSLSPSKTSKKARS